MLRSFLRFVFRNKNATITNVACNAQTYFNVSNNSESIKRAKYK